MLKELPSKFLNSELGREMAEELILGWWRRELFPEGKPYYDDFISKVLRGERISLSNCKDMFRGFDQESGIKGLENLEGLKNKPVLVVANHPNPGPISGGWKYVTLSYHIKNATGNELRIMHGHDPNARLDFFREDLFKCINTVPIRDPNPARASALIEAINDRDTMCLFAEGGYGPRDKKLRRGMREAGIVMIMCLSRNYEVATASIMYKKSGVFFVTFDRIDFDKDQLKKMNGQEVVDTTMVKIASHLPPDHRGYYEQE